MVWAPGTDFAEGGEKWVRGNGFSSDYEAAGTLTTTLTYRPIINSAFSGEGTLFTKGLHQTIRSAFSGTGTTTTSLDRPRLNLFTRPSAEGLGTAWIYNSTPNYYNNVTIELSSEQAYVGTQSYKLTSTRVGDVINYILMYSPLGTAAHPVVPGADYAVSYYAKAGTVGGKNLGVGLRFYDIDGNDIGTSGGFAATASLTAWNRVSAVYTAPGIAAYAAVQVYVGEVAVDEVYYIDGVMLEQSSTVKPYFDGSTTLAGRVNTWLGTAHNSVSRSAVQGAVTINSNYSGEGTLSTTGVHPVIRSAFSGEGSLTTSFHQNQAFSSLYSGEGTTSTVWSNYRNIYSDFSGEGSLSTDVFSGLLIRSSFSGTGHFSTKLNGLPVTITSAFSGEGVTSTELEYIVAPLPLEALPLGKLVRYTVNNASVPLNPAQGAGSTPSVNATYIKGRNPEFALGEVFTVDNAAVGRYTGEIVRLALGKKSDVATISTDTLLTLANVDLHLYPFIDAAPSTWTAARAIDYFTQQCGMFYDKVDGECSVYASGFGHTNGYAKGVEKSHFYGKLTAGSTSTSVLNGRSVTSFGAAATSVMAQHEAPKTRVPITVGAGRKMVFSLGLGLRGTGRTATASYNFVDGADITHTVSIEAASAGTITAKLNGAAVTSVSVVAGGNYRVAFSLERMSETALMVKLTAHGDDLAGNGELVANGQAEVITAALPATLWLTSLVHASAGGSGAEMLHWGTYLSVARTHLLAVPRTQKALAQSKKPLGYVSGFSGNVWKMVNEFCSINHMDLSFLEDRLVAGPRSNGFNGSVKFSNFEVTAERREKYRQVAVVNKQSKAVTTNDAVLWRADSVFQVAAREVFETTVQTGHSILSLAQPVAVNGIWPFPYKQGAGQYVVTGADGYIIAPAWWNDNGGKVEVSLTEVEGEIAIKITAPTQDTVRAPYRISEGEGDRPALYVSGSGIVNDPVELHIATGATKAREGFDSVFESPFIATANDAYNTAVRMAHEYSAAAADVTYEVPNDFDTPSVLGTYPAGVVFTDNERNFKITDAAQTHSQVSGSAVPFTTLAAYNASFPAGATIRDEKARHAGRTIKQANIKPLRSNDESA